MGGEGVHDLMSAYDVCVDGCAYEENHAAFRQTLTVPSVPRAYLRSRLGVQTLRCPWVSRSRERLSSLTRVPFWKTPEQPAHLGGLVCDRVLGLGSRKENGLDGNNLCLSTVFVICFLQVVWNVVRGVGEVVRTTLPRICHRRRLATTSSG